jgi:UTP--glucose-1-phosphate uridylyltransferase
MYGIATVEATDEDDVVQITGLVEKPAAGSAPSNLAIIGRYVLRPEVFDILEVTEPGKGGEIQLTDALQVLAANPNIAGGVYGVVFRGRRYDTGDRLDYIKAIIQLAVDRQDLGPALRPWLRDFASKME